LKEKLEKYGINVSELVRKKLAEEVEKIERGYQEAVGRAEKCLAGKSRSSRALKAC
jgi:hypothetical protein